MFSKSLIEQTKCRWREFRREPSAFFWVIFMPILWMLVLGIAFSQPKQEHYGVGVLSNSEATHGTLLLRALQSSKQVAIRKGDEKQLDTWFKRGEIVLGVRPTPEGVTFLLDPLNPESTRAQHFVNNLKFLRILLWF